MGYFSYDYFGYSEVSAKGQVEDTEKFPDVDLMLFDKVIAFDHETDPDRESFRLMDAESGRGK